MADRALRGMKIGANSLENDVGVDLAPRIEAISDCPGGRTIIITFAADADIPPVWEAPGGGEALLRDATRPDPTPTKPVRTHWGLLLERRTEKAHQELHDAP